MLSSKGEIKIHNILEEANLPFEEEYTFPDLRASNNRELRFDFAVFDDNGDIDFLIEFNGRQHYQPVSIYGGRKGLYQQKHNDIEKRKYCHKNNIKLVTIPWYDLEKIDYDYIMKAAGYY